MASGVATSRPYLDGHWDDSREDEALYIKARFDVLLDPEREGVLSLSELQDGALGQVNWRTQSSGISITPEAAAALERRWNSFLRERGQSPAVLPEELNTPSLYFEGASRTISVNAYERDPRARKACLKHYGAVCYVCNFNFVTVYGELGRDFIHVHHIVPLARVGKNYVVDPVNDLRPVCPNCHAMLHRGQEVLSIDELKTILRNAVSPVQTD
jgi:5-methylcytosine-specific restriction protein A